MNNKDMPAMAFYEIKGITDGKVTKYNNYKGLTKREMFAMNLMNGILSNNAYSYDGFNGAAKMALDAADALLEELERSNKQ